MQRSMLIAGFWALLSNAGVVSVDQKAYDGWVHNESQSLVLFTAAGCAACEEAVKVLEQTQLGMESLLVAEVNCSEEPYTCDAARIFDVPSLAYSAGDGSLVRIARYMKRQLGPVVTEVNNVDHEDFRNPSFISVVAFIAASDSAARNAFETLGQKYQAYYNFAVSEIGTVVAEANTSQPGMIVFKPFDEKKSSYQGSLLDITAMEQFLKSATRPLIQEMDPLLYEDLVEIGNPVLFILDENLDKLQKLAGSLYTLAANLRGRMNFLTVNTKNYPSHGRILGLGEDVMQGIAIEDVETTRKYPMPSGGHSAAAIEAFVTKYLAGKIKPVIRSDPVSAASQNSTLVTLVGKTFDDFVLDSTKDVLVELSAPWCDYCADLHGQMTKLAEKYKALGLSDKVAFAKVDVSTNDVPVRVTEYPTLRLFRAGDNEMKSFQGTFHELLTEEQLAMFIQENGANNAGSLLPAIEDSEDSQSSFASAKDEL